jgi:hypothetical protein
MICCTTKREDIEGLARFPVTDVIEACKGTLRSIHASRSRMRREFVESELQSQLWWWNHLWKWVTLGLAPRPSRRSALNEYYNRRLPPVFHVVMSYGEQEQVCKRLLKAAENTPGHSMAVTVKAANKCNLC